MLTRAGLPALHRARRQMPPSALQVPIFFPLNRFGFAVIVGTIWRAPCSSTSRPACNGNSDRRISVVRLVMGDTPFAIEYRAALRLEGR